MSPNPTPGEILAWFPTKWSEIAGNGKIIQIWWGFLVHGLCNALFTGPNRTGKTRVIMLGIKALLCLDRSPNLDPCGKCLNCKALDKERHAHTDIFANLNESRYQFKVIDCEEVSREELLRLKSDVNLDDPKTIIYLDEVTSLQRRGLEQLLWKPMDESHSIWLASSIKTRKLKTKKSEKRDRNYLSLPMQGRFGVKVGTTFPSEAELSQWIKDRCRQWNLTIIEEDVSVPEMMKITNRRVGYVIHILAAAAARGRVIDPTWLQTFNMGPED